MPCLQACRTMQAPIDYSQVDSDPAVRRQMMARRAYQGVWGISVELNTHIVEFSADGNGLMSCCGCVLPFNWTADREGRITCRFDPDLARHEKVWTESTTCIYSPELNEMMADNVDAMRRGDLVTNWLPYRGAGESLAGIDARLAEGKRDPEVQYQIELERLAWGRRVASGEIAKKREEIARLRSEKLSEATQEIQKDLERWTSEGEPYCGSVEGAERVFCAIEDRALKGAYVEYVRSAFPGFHPEWGKAGWIRYIWPW